MYACRWCVDVRLQPPLQLSGRVVVDGNWVAREVGGSGVEHQGWRKAAICCSFRWRPGFHKADRIAVPGYGPNGP